MYWIVKLSERKGQYRVTLPRSLLIKAGLVNAELLLLNEGKPGIIEVSEYYGKKDDKRDIQNDQT